MTSAELKADLTTLLAGVLGEYTRNGEVMEPAVSVGARLPPGYQVRGLEVSIRSSPDVHRVNEFGSSPAFKRTWQVRLKQWDDEGNLEEPIRLILSAYPQTSNPTIVGPTDEYIESCGISLVEN